jgi:cytochrome P450
MSVRRAPPGPPGSWLTGSLGEFRRDKLGFLTRCARQYGDVASFRLGPRRIYLLSHPDLVEQVLVTEARHFVKHYVLHLLRPVLGNGLLLSEGTFWLRQRRLMQPAFLRPRIEGYADLMVRRTVRMLEGWREGQVLDLHAEMVRLTLGVTVEALLGIDLTGDSSEVSRAVDVLMEDFNARFESAFPPPEWLPTPRNLRLRRAVRVLDGVIHDIIRRRRASGGAGNDLLSVLLRARDEEGGGMTDRQLRDEVMTLFLAGHETTANALAWTGYLLAQHPQVEARLAAEVADVLGGRPPAAADLPRLGFAERVVLESMRVYPPVYAFGRRAVRPCVIGGYEVPAGSTVMLSQWVLHRDGRFFERPEEFDPDRWAGEGARRVPKYAYFPFGGGPRVCVGNGFALAESVLVLATLAGRFRWALVPGKAVKPWPAVTLRPAEGIPVVVSRRAGG